MAKGPPKKYQPGELDAVRKKLGDIPPDEAKRIAEKLGGEVGVEKSEWDIQRETLRGRALDKPRRISDVVGNDQEEPVARFRKISISRDGTSLTEEKDAKKSLPYLDRVRTDFLCRRPEYNLKSLRGAVGSLFSFFLPVPDNVKPSFLKEAEKVVYQPLFNLVKATRALYTKTREDVFKKISDHKLYSAILKTIKDWDIESIEQEILHLRKRFRNQNTRNLLRLCKMIYTPIIRLSLLDENNQIMAAYRWSYNINLKGVTTRAADKQRLATYYYDIEKNLPFVMHNIKQMLYPVLLKRLAGEFCFFEEFFLTKREEIIDFLGIDSYDIIDPVLLSEKKKERPQEPMEKPAEKEVSRGERIPLAQLPDDVLKGLNCLEKLYPRAGWFNLEEFPDFYPYFQPVYNFPNGFELIPPGDPLHQVVVLLSILNDLFYGMRDIKFGHLRDKDLMAYNIQGNVERLLSPWPLFMDEILSKVYVPRLIDYCRQIEKDKAFKLSEVGKKIETELNWVKRNYLLPFLSYKMQSQVVGIVKRQMPKLFVLTAQLKEILVQVVQELKQKADGGSAAKPEGITNPWAQYIFDLKNNTSKRLDKVLFARTIDKDGNKRTIDRRNNANLLSYIVSILSVLDYYINNKESHFYYSPSTRIFRTVHEGSDIPQYSVRTINPDDFAPDNDFAEDLEPRELTPPPAEKSVSPSLREALQLKIESFTQTAKNFTVIYFCLFEDKADAETLSAFRERLSQRLEGDKDFLAGFDDEGFVVLLAEHDLGASIRWIKEFFAATEHGRIGSGVFQYQSGWRYGYVMKVLEKTRQFTANQGPAHLVYLDSARNKFRSLSLI